MIRPFQAETLRYGPYSVAGEFVYDRPFQWGSKRTGPDLARVGGRYSDEWHRVHLNNPRDLVPESNMPPTPSWPPRRWTQRACPSACRCCAPWVRPYSDEEIAKSVEDVKGKTQLEAVIAYLQVLGTARSAKKASPAAAAPPRLPKPLQPHPAASVVVDNGVVKFYFASGKADLAAGGAEALAEAAKAAKEGKKLSQPRLYWRCHEPGVAKPRFCRA